MGNTGNHDNRRPKQPRLPTLVTKVTTNVFRSSYKLSVILSYFNQNWNVSTDFGEDPQQLPSRNFLQSQSSCSKQNKRHKEMTKLSAAFHSCCVMQRNIAGVEMRRTPTASYISSSQSVTNRTHI